ncbi:hypothetical protein SSABA_v1c07070 [Spiroplasma sabaudiense Ar-1343]|uniref:Uncharacterized protein n=1 Tax=Spiroplasma sabaudiense Ar-1343 TaxID=1276257 RepID=W6AK56_9MOLU|nr:hypothetical protein [Spiroplasma sabaudiense]AHI54109.1 hypothetical protein SSABA_v1c07070 [Spiroplasma sabaudiense Ar-1343]
MYGQNFNSMMMPNAFGQPYQPFFANGRWFYTDNISVYTYPENIFAGPLSVFQMQMGYQGRSNSNNYMYSIDKIIMDYSLPKSVEDIFNGGSTNFVAQPPRPPQPAPAPAPKPAPAPAPETITKTVYVQTPAPAPAPIIVNVPEQKAAPAPAPAPIIVNVPEQKAAPAPAPEPKEEPKTESVEMFAEFERLVDETIRASKAKKNSDSRARV